MFKSKKMVSGLCMLLALILPILSVSPVHAGDSYKEKIEKMKDTIDFLEEEKEFLSELLSVQNSQIDNTEAVVYEVENAYLLAKQLYDERKQEVKTLRKRQSDLDKLLVTLTSPYELASAWEEYIKAGETKGAFKKLYLKVRGKQPPSSMLNQYDLEAKMIEIEIRRKVAVPVGMALAKLGDVLLTVMEGIAKKVASNATKASSLMGMYKNVKKMRSVPNLKKAKKLSEKVESMGRQMKTAERQRFVSGLMGKSKTVAGERQKLVSEVLNDGKDLSGYIDFGVTDYLSEDLITEVGSWIPYRESVSSWLGSENKAKELADELYNMSQKLQYGTEDRKRAHEQVTIQKSYIDRHLQAVEEDLEELEIPMKKSREKMEKAKGKLDEARETGQDLVELLDYIDNEIVNLEAEINFLDYKQSVGRRIYPICGRSSSSDELIYPFDSPTIYQEDLVKKRPRMKDSKSTLNEKFGAHFHMAADEITAQTIERPNQVKFRIEAAIGELLVGKCGYESDGVICKKPLDVWAGIFSANNPPGGEDWQKAGAVSISTGGKGVISIDNGNRVIKAVSPGIVGLASKGQVVEDKEKVVNHTHKIGNTEREIKKYDTILDFTNLTTEPKKILIHKLEDVKFKVMLENDYFVDDVVDFFITEKDQENARRYSSQGAQLFTRAFIMGDYITSIGSQTYLLAGIPPTYSAELIHQDGKKSGFWFFEETEKNTQLRVNWNTHGKYILRLGLKDRDGKLHFSQDIDVIQNLVFSECDVPVDFPGLKSSVGVLPIGDKAVYRVVVDGWSNMENYEVQWYADEDNMRRNLVETSIDFPKKTSFKKTDDNKWVSEFSFKFDIDLLDEVASIQDFMEYYDQSPGFLPKAQIVRKEDSRVVKTVEGFKRLYAGVPRIKSFETAMVGEGVVPVAAIDLFCPDSKRQKGLNLALKSKLSGFDESFVLPLQKDDTSLIGPASSVLKLSRSGHLYISDEYFGEDKASRGHLLVSKFKSALLYEGIVLDEDEISDSLEINLNKMVAEKALGSNTKRRLRVIGPADMSIYKAQWHLDNGQKKTQEFRQLKDNEWVSEISSKQRFEKIDIITSQNIVKASYKGIESVFNENNSDVKEEGFLKRIFQSIFDFIKRLFK